ncbi:MAG TPA: crosslink repair DNA glycosylase YcaQ family protein [Chloroflexota bacterium]|jgi:hypothetical protein|nr:crosslink repair DNA glycosylase YcaQ family protein [Chloroflexota bacterium]
MPSLSLREARWLALEAQGLAQPRPQRPIDSTAILEAAYRTAILQLDAINVLERTQHLVLFSRLGAYDRGLLHDLQGPNKPLWEYWARAASLIPMGQQPLFRWRMGHSSPYRAGPDSPWQRWRDQHAEYIDAVLREVRERGPLAAGQLSDPRRRNGEWWERRSLGRQALEWLFFKGEVAAWRTANFERVYDLPERVIPSDVLAQPTPTIEAAHHTLLMQAARALGVATANELAGFYRIVPAGSKRVAELVEAGELEEVAVEGWSQKAYVPSGTRPKQPQRQDAAFLSPFDLLIQDRERTRRLFGFNYQIEVYVPEPKRQYGYYVLPVLLGDELVGRLDLKADRQAGTLRVLGAFAEPEARPPDPMPILHELQRMKDWLGLARVDIAANGDLAPILASATM